ncbi:MAG TPA: class I SAM-dependent methyltransferase, partial [Gaiellaceae bacterium]
MPPELKRISESAFAPSHDDVLLELAGAKNYNEWLFGRAAPYLGTHVLDVGAGIGTFTELALEHGASVTALEPDTPFADYLRGRFDPAVPVEVVEADLMEFDRPGAFDSIICFNVLEHVRDDAAAVRHFRELLAPNGRLLLLVPAHRWLSSPFDAAVGHERRYEKGELRELLIAGGVATDVVRYVNPVGALGWLVSMRLRRRAKLPTGQLRVFDRIVPAIRVLDRL